MADTAATVKPGAFQWPTISTDVPIEHEESVDDNPDLINKTQSKSFVQNQKSIKQIEEISKEKTREAKRELAEQLKKNIIESSDSEESDDETRSFTVKFPPKKRKNVGSESITTDIFEQNCFLLQKNSDLLEKNSKLKSEYTKEVEKNSSLKLMYAELETRDEDHKQEITKLKDVNREMSLKMSSFNKFDKEMDEYFSKLHPIDRKMNEIWNEIEKNKKFDKKLLIIQGGIRSFVEDIKVFNTLTSKDYSFMRNEHLFRFLNTMNASRLKEMNRMTEVINKHIHNLEQENNACAIVVLFFIIVSIAYLFIKVY